MITPNQKNSEIFAVGDKCVHLDDAWSKLKNYRIRSIADNEIVLGEYADVMNHSNPLCVPTEEREKIIISPYSRSFRDRDSQAYELAGFVFDRASSYLRAHVNLEVDELVNHIIGAKDLEKLPRGFVKNCLLCCVASELFVANSDRRKKNPPVVLELSSVQREIESQRTFAGTLAGELSSLSERVRHLIRHKSTVGTYRENLLHILLRKNLPERYHVATGFILGSPRQIDILIYDRLDYAPVFREGDLVVVRPESVRAIIEVKTKLTRAQLNSSLIQIKQLSHLDDCSPPFFKGIFAFEAEGEASTLMQNVVDFYTNEKVMLAIDEDDEDDDGLNHIMTPYHHLTNFCVLGLAYGEVRYRRDEKSKKIYPGLFSMSSATGLNAQAALFLECLLSHLRFGGLKPAAIDPFTQMLGADTQMALAGKLTEEDWGAYFGLLFGIDEAETDVKETEKTIISVERWRKGAAWKDVI